MEKDRYSLQPSERNGWYVIVDKANGFMLSFKAHDFLHTQEVTILEDIEDDVIDMDIISDNMALISQWMHEHYGHLIA